MKLQILGTGCAKCRTLAENVKAAVDSLGIDAEIEKVESIEDIIRFGVMSTPALVVDGKVKAAGRMLSVTEIEDILKH